MKTFLVCGLVLCLLSGGVSAEIYRSVDQDGNVVYSDQPGQGGKKVQLPEISTYEPKPIPPGTLTPTPAEAAPAAPAPKLRFVQPGADETIFDNQGNLDVALRVEPPLKPDQRLALQLDGGTPTEIGTSSYHYSGLDRGTHTLQAWVVGHSGEPVGEQTSVTFHLRQASKLFRKPTPRSGPVQSAPRAPTAPNVPANGG